jgi:hypothetical protein
MKGQEMTGLFGVSWWESHTNRWKYEDIEQWENVQILYRIEKSNTEGWKQMFTSVLIGLHRNSTLYRGENIEL